MKNGMALPMQSANNSNISSPANSCLSFTNTNITTNSTIATTPAVAAATFVSVVDSSTSLFQEEQKPIIPLQDARSSYWGLDALQQHSNTINQFGFGAINDNFFYSSQ
uniref:Uncharacterized protein n=1 Tax=Opuntia streptacantha TaxID=393608 RepID=A0A7C8ZE25_OPUST